MFQTNATADTFFVRFHTQTSPVTQRSVVNENFASSQAALDCLKYHEVTFDRMQYSRPGYGSDDDPDTAEIAWLLRMASGDRDIKYEGDIYTSVYFPVYNNFDSVNRESVGVMRAVLHWAKYFENVLPESTGGLVVVLENGCDDPFTYQINGKKVVPLGHGDLHDEEYDKYMRSASFASIQTINDGTKSGMKVHFDECTFMIRTYPSDHMVELYTTSTPVVITASVALVFLFAVLMFFVYDRMVERRQRILMEKAKKTHQIVVSLFPKNVRDQILNDDGDLRHNGVLGAKNTLKSFVSGGMENNQIFGQMPIADLYPESTVMVRSEVWCREQGLYSFSSHKNTSFSLLILLVLPVGHQAESLHRFSYCSKLCIRRLMRSQRKGGSSKCKFSRIVHVSSNPKSLSDSVFLFLHSETIGDSVSSAGLRLRSVSVKSFLTYFFLVSITSMLLVLESQRLTPHMPSKWLGLHGIV